MQLHTGVLFHTSHMARSLFISRDQHIEFCRAAQLSRYFIKGDFYSISNVRSDVNAHQGPTSVVARYGCGL